LRLWRCSGESSRKLSRRPHSSRFPQNSRLGYRGSDHLAY
jgi:hypothetical protein